MRRIGWRAWLRGLLWLRDIGGVVMEHRILRLGSYRCIARREMTRPRMAKGDSLYIYSLHYAGHYIKLL